ncbi:MAG: DUF4920 domain-containing protein [Reichenbachiella sp.]|uniref:DUF4920 domain-containing protein n=1 Tax=Reichenbachiella sp. TaxID=2184521 RepID=UPI003297A17C
MKNLILFSFLSLVFFSCGKKQVSQEKPAFQSYGEAFDYSISKDISGLSNIMANSDSVITTLNGTIEKTCAVKGCWMQLQTSDGNTLRVTFKDYGFFVPKSGVENKKATINGYCVKQLTSVEELRHYAQDAGESEEIIASITEAKTEYSFVASGVIIED